MTSAPRISSVQPYGQLTLKVLFENGVEKIYDCASLITRPMFQALSDSIFFKTVKKDPGGYGISWNDEIDISEDELWYNGKILSSLSHQQPNSL